MRLEKFERCFYQDYTTSVAKNLLGQILVHQYQGKVYQGRIVETEAYLGAHDLACHTSKGMTPRTKVMFGPAGFAYVYLIYGMYHCFNVVTEEEGQGSAVLIRAVEPLDDLDSNTKGPGRLSRAMQITKAQNGQDLLSDTLFIAKDATIKKSAIVARPRIGVDYAKEWALKPLRFYIKENPYISKK